MNQKDINDLYDAIVSIDNKEDCKDFLDDLCTYKEIEQFSQRFKAAKLLSKGDTYEQVTAKTDISSATLSRVSRCLKFGKGYKKIINK